MYFFIVKIYMRARALFNPVSFKHLCPSKLRTWQKIDRIDLYLKKGHIFTIVFRLLIKLSIELTLSRWGKGGFPMPPGPVVLN